MSTFWACVIVGTVLLYIILDGFDLGVGMLYGWIWDEDSRSRMLAAISPVWDGNETWLVITGTVLFGAFPLVYATLLSAFYIPLIAMLGGLILRGVSFEFRQQARRSRALWDSTFVGGSLLAAFMQGVMVGALVQGVPMEGRHFSGGHYDWLTLFTSLCGGGLCLGYTLLGTCWLISKSDGLLRDRMYRAVTAIVLLLGVTLIVIFVVSVQTHLQMLARWTERPILFACPVTGLIAAALLVRATVAKNDGAMFPVAAIAFLSAFATMAVSFWPYMIPFSITIADAAAPPSSMSFMFWGAGVVVLPLTLVYTSAVYRVFRGRVTPSAHTNGTRR
jgi:cytochrome d ubiquinol oxidase subunit II